LTIIYERRVKRILTIRVVVLLLLEDIQLPYNEIVAKPVVGVSVRGAAVEFGLNEQRRQPILGVR
jgi:hypothetical protein